LLTTFHILTPSLHTTFPILAHSLFTIFLRYNSK
jgi:hypothetical protein